MRERSERVESPGTYVTELVSSCHFDWHCVLSDLPPVLWWLSPGEGRVPLHYAVGINCKKGATTENQGSWSSIWAKVCILMIVCVCVFVFFFFCVCVCFCVFVFVFVFVCLFLCLFLFVCVCFCLCVFVFVCVLSDFT